MSGDYIDLKEIECSSADVKGIKNVRCQPTTSINLYDVPIWDLLNKIPFEKLVQFVDENREE